MTTGTDNPRTATDETLVFFRPFNNLDVLRTVGHFWDAAMEHPFPTGSLLEFELTFFG